MQRVLRLLRAVPHHMERHFAVVGVIFGCSVCGHPAADGLQRVLCSHRVADGSYGCREPRRSHVLVERLSKRRILSQPRNGE